jgi:hypothetical protein
MGIFQIRPDIPVTIQNARDAKEYCSTYEHVPQSEVYAIYGVDGDMVKKYLHVVEEFENAYKRARVDESKRSSIFKLSFRGYTIWISKD